MFQKLFNPENALMITMTQITDCIFLSLFWMVGCFPVVTAGASFAALYDAVYYGFRKGDKHPWSRFWRTFRGSWKAGLVPTGIALGAAVLLGKWLIGLWNSAASGQLSMMVFSGAAFAGVLVIGIGSVLFPLLSRFETGVAQLLKNTVLLAMANLPRTLVLGILNLLTIVLCAVYVFPLFFLPALTALISTLFLEPMFKPYMPEEVSEKASP